jgi:hypothetical protein
MGSVSDVYTGTMKGRDVFSRCIQSLRGVLDDSRQERVSRMREANWGVAVFCVPVTCQRCFGRVVAAISAVLMPMR